MVDVAQSVRALDCGSRCRGFESHLPPKTIAERGFCLAFLLLEVLDSNARIHRTSNNNELAARCNNGESGYFVRVARILLNIFSKVSSPRLRRSSPIFHPKQLQSEAFASLFLFLPRAWQTVCIVFYYSAIRKYNRIFIPKAVPITIFMLIFAVQKTNKKLNN